ncbi:MAG: 5-bromo-4-chloroindolyl phosphate hydrolysis family protein [Lachnospiraceae bacterium]|nr:5-bromo-4-chloroindolyl phosphate hydrolysis family protein [Lachnospiraceae bacterium]
MIDDVLDGISKAIDAVDEAVSRQDFLGLSRELGDIFKNVDKSNLSSRTAGGPQSSGPQVKPGGSTQKPDGQKRGSGPSNRGPAYNGNGRYTGYGNSWNSGNMPQGTGAAYGQKVQSAQRYTSAKTKTTSLYKKPSTTGWTLLTIAGFVGLGVMGIPGLLGMVLGGGILKLVGGTLLIPALAAGAAGIAGLLGGRKAKRVSQYIKVLGDKHYANVKDLAKAVNLSEKKTVEELKALTQQKVFPQGHFDADEKTFMASDEMYRQYLNIQEDKAAEQKRRDEADAEFAGIDPEVVTMIKNGRRYVKEIRAHNDAIPDPVITEKLSHMELIVDRIFKEVKKDPTLGRRLNMLMDYYLPTTDKLLTAYRELSAQPVQGDNIKTARAEIENSLDIINTAFEKLLDSFFEADAVDLSSDIAVMKTVMRQQGLTPGELNAEVMPEGEWENGPTLQELNEQIRQHEQEPVLQFHKTER